ncbi:F-box only protein 12-like [Arabidopsis lyrata subsp. lyrata]|uniref:F-box only protein 12-like n=1 Tax=Arabidopsis lyrata subsp. lyrata TaxID=81972 RepID=UPI000A29B5E5|nr:F-box only protein 12-like [Arabidopsis lyrata subsp. lyrata]|eukprot:XP_020869783.1 F-box only protein 12-like [Arabidopsis lyrata subsp. lyrata]
MNSIPNYLIYEILSRLSAKSVARCPCVSKEWRSILARQDFTELFLTRSKARPRLLIGVRQQDGDQCSFYTTPQPQDPYEKPSLVVTADFHIKLSKGISQYNCSYASGLIYYSIRSKDEDEKRVICNPLTGQYVILPELRVGHSYSYTMFSYLMFDPIDKEFKVLFMNLNRYTAYNYVDHYILTLGSGKLRWRKIQCPFTHELFEGRICINGVLYYSAEHSDSDGRRSCVLVCFDVRSEKFKFIGARNCHYQLINYKGKLCEINVEYAYDGRFPPKLSMWVLEDVEKPEWSKYVYSLDVESKVASYLYVSGMTATGDIVLLMDNTSNPFYVFYFNPERKTLQIVEILGIGSNRVCTFVDYVEDLSVNVALQNKSSPLQERRNIVTEKLKTQQRRHTSHDLCKFAPSVKNKQHNKYESLANMLYRSAGLAILFFVLFGFFFVFFSYIIRL